MSTQTGPRLTIVASCKGCRWLSWGTCTADRKDAMGPPGELGRKIPMWPLEAPDWCHELPAARLALARSVVTEGPCDYCRARDKGHATFARGCTCATKEPSQ